MNNDDTEIEEMVEEVLVCGDCGRVNYVLDSVTRSTAVRCSGCSALLRAERPRPVRVDCPVCHEEVEVESNKAGQMARCGNCGADFELAGEGKSAPRAVRPGVADDEMMMTTITRKSWTSRGGCGGCGGRGRKRRCRAGPARNSLCSFCPGW